MPDTAPNLHGNNAPAIKPTKEEKSWWESWGSDVIHTGLDVVGLIPGVGEIADGANALIYLAEGDKVNAAISAAAMIPGAGMAATGAKYGKKVVGAVAEGVAKKGGREAAEAAAEKGVKEATEETAEQAAKKGKPGGKDKGKVKPKPECGKSGPYKDRKDHDNAGMNWDHVPSQKALLERAAKVKGAKLSPEETKAIVENAPTIAIPTKLHQKRSETYGGRQHQTIDGVRRPERDSQDLQRAAKENTDAILEKIDEYDPGCKGAYKTAAKKITDMTDADWQKWLKKTIKSAGDD